MNLLGKAVIFLNGTPYADTISKSPQDIFVCADGAYNWAHINHDIDMVVGDMDSVECMPTHIDIVKVPVRKNFSDGYLAIDLVIGKGYRDIRIVGADGGRLDHQYANLMLLKAIGDRNSSGVILTNNCQIYLISRPSVLSVSKNSTVSVVPLGAYMHISNTRGLEYPFPDRRVCGHDGLGMSNVATEDEIYLELVEGEAFVFVSR